LFPVSEPKPFPFRIDFPPALPISVRAEEIVATIQEHQVVILAGETGSGKTTQIPKMCLAAGRGVHGRIACTQPRRVAALSIARRVAEELGVNWGREVGSKVRFDDRTSSATVIKFLTDGMLLAEVQGDPLLREYDTVIIDEAHERSLNIDFLLGHLRNLRFRRPDLKIVITSATIDTAAFSTAFDDAPVITVEGRTYPVEVIYAPLDELGRDDDSDEAPAKAEAVHYIDGAVESVERILRESDAGDVLVFLPSERDIREVSDLLDGRFARLHARPEIVPLFGRLTNAEQQRVFASSQRRKIVVATNIAETSLTIPGIRFVVDTGLARISRYAPQARTRRLPIEPVAQSSADQRKGRSGRVADGVCIRLYSEQDFLARPRFTQPEIQRANLADVILRMKAFGLGDIERFPFLNMPAAKSIRAGYALLEELGALQQEDLLLGRGARGPGHEARTDGDLPFTNLEPSAPRPAPPAVATQLSPLGRELARLPVDPTVGRMVLQARTEKALREVLVIAAGLSVQDPRERPLDKQAQADAAHRRFTHPDSDYLTLLEIWDSVHGEFDTMSQARLRRFCRDHFLSYTRMREWRDIHGQLLDALEQRDGFRMTSIFDGMKPDAAAGEKLLFGSPGYRAIHRSILAGLLGNIARLDEENGGYKATHDRKVSLFPGSALYQRDDPKKKTNPSRSAPKARGPRWIMAAEITETTRLYARTCARLDPAWALELGAHLVRVAHSEPFWDESQGRVMVRRRTRLYGLEIDSRAVGYGRVDPVHATELFIREGLVNDTITWPFDFLQHNRQVRAAVESDLTRTRDRGYLNLDEAIYRFYAARLMPRPILQEGAKSTENPGIRSRRPQRPPVENSEVSVGISAVAELVDLMRERRGAEPKFLMMTPDDLRDPEAPGPDREAFPEALPLENAALPLAYAYRPGQAEDGVTLEVGVREAEDLSPAALDWAVPGHLPDKVEFYLKSLPKELRRAFVPLTETAKAVAAQVAQRDRLTGRRESLAEALAAHLREGFRLAVDPEIWAGKPLPDHLRVRVRVVDAAGQELCASRELAEIHAALDVRRRAATAAAAKAEPPEWVRARVRWEKPPQTAWTFGDIPEEVEVGDHAGVPLLAWPGLLAQRDGVALRLFRTVEEARGATATGLAALLERQLGGDLGWLERDLRALRTLGPLAATLTPMESLQEDAFAMIRGWVCDAGRVGNAVPGGPGSNGPAGGVKARDAGHVVPCLAAAAFAAAVEKAKADLRGLVPRFTDLLREILTLRQALLVHPTPPAGLDRDLDALIPAGFLRLTPYPQLAHFPRYLKAMKVRADRWKQNPTKDAERAAQLAPYAALLAKVRSEVVPVSPPGERSVPGEGTRTTANAVIRFRWLVEEFRVSLFAQELGTAEPVSVAKLDRARAELPVGPASAPLPAKAEAPPKRPLLTDPAKKTAPLKNLSALDNLFRR
jgi:ATP-dependent helicase HrpA